MSDCQDRVLSQDYWDFIVEYKFTPGTQDYREKYCIVNVGSKYNVIYLPAFFSGELSINQYTYTAIPKLYAPMDIGAVENIGAGIIAREPALKLDGSGVIIGVIDSGINYLSKAFRRVSGETKIVTIWDMTEMGNEEFPSPQNFDFGREYSEEQINEALNSENPLDIVPLLDESGHGTAIAGIAAGNVDIESEFSGVAHGASLAIVKLKEAKDYLKDFYGVRDGAVVYQENDIMLGVSYLLKVADRLKRPLVIVLGVGTSSGSHNGDGPLSEYLEDIGTRPGICVVTCAGNEGNEGLHFSGQVGQGEGQDVEILVENSETFVNEGVNGNSSFTAEIWCSATDILSVGFVAPSGESIAQIPARKSSTSQLEFVFQNTEIYVDYRIVETQSGSELIFIRFKNTDPGIWIIRVFGVNIVTGKYNIWLPVRSTLGDNIRFVSPDPEVTITGPGDTTNIITVGAYNYVTNSIYTATGRGFKSNGLIKPDFVAPGVKILVPAGNGNLNTSYIRKTGTSIAAGITAGACALLLQWGVVKGNQIGMNSKDIKTYLIRGAQRDRDIEYPDRAWGYGTLDIYNAFDRNLTEK